MKIQESYIENICKNCKADCENSKGIIVISYEKDGLYTISSRCVDYKRDNSIESEYKESVHVTGKKSKGLMGLRI